MNNNGRTIHTVFAEARQEVRKATEARIKLESLLAELAYLYEPTEEIEAMKEKIWNAILPDYKDEAESCKRVLLSSKKGLSAYLQHHEKCVRLLRELIPTIDTKTDKAKRAKINQLKKSYSKISPL